MRCQSNKKMVTSKLPVSDMEDEEITFFVIVCKFDKKWIH